MKKTTKVSALTCLMLIATGAFSREILNNPPNPNYTPAKITAGCTQTTAQKDLDYNNVRARIFVGGDMWWDMGPVGNPQYEVPKGSAKHSSFAASIWVGGLDAGNNIKAAAQNYRQTGNDYWGGPIQVANFSITKDRCDEFNRLWKIRKQDVASFRKNPDFEASTADEIGSKTDIIEWPGNGGPGEDQFLAPFHDGNADGIYDPRALDVAGLPVDYPNYNFSGVYLNVSSTIPKVVCNDYLFGDQTIWWVFNDVGGVKNNTNSAPIGLEIRAQGFSFKTNDAINDMTFYKYQIINRSSSLFKQTYFGQWADCDLGYYKDDYVRCNVKLGLGITYNGDLVDELPDGYGNTPPAVGIDFFQGPEADVDDNIDNDRDGCIDCSYLTDPNTGLTITVPDTDLPEQIIMSKFVYYNNSTGDPIQGEPNNYIDYYNYLKGIWKNGVRMTWGGTGYNPGSTDTCDFMFPGTTDLTHSTSNPVNWTEEVTSNVVDDRRMLQSAGPFTLQPGAVNFITVGVVWARAASGDNTASIASLEEADVKAQALFDYCFKTLDGPDAPDLVIRELDKELIFSLHNTDTTATERYSAKDPAFTDTTFTDEQKSYKFQGYQVYQLKTAEGSLSDIQNHPDDIKLLFQCDIKDGINQIVNYSLAPFSVYTAEVKASGADAGITHTFKVDRDLFAVGNTALVNHKTYYYTVVAYAYNNYQTFDPLNSQLGGQQKPYLAGRNNIKNYSAIPHFIDPENGGTILNSGYGDGPVITRIQGQGNGGMKLDFTQGTVDEILNSPSHRALHPSYMGGKGPIDVKVYDPLLVRGLDFTNTFNGVADDSRWTMLEHGSGIQVVEDTTISQFYEQVFSTDHKQKGPDGKDLKLNWGISANIHKVLEPGGVDSIGNGFIDATISYKDNSARWINFLENSTGDTYENWIRSVNGISSPKKDPLRVYESVLNGTWAPLAVCAVATSSSVDSLMPKPSAAVMNDIQLGLSPGSPSNLVQVGIASVDIVFTSDQSKWSRAAVIEMGNKITYTIGGASRFDLRKSASIDKNGNMNFPSSDNDDFSTGMGWFPGYAVNLETGERLNIVYGENSGDPGNNGTDMKWNPTENVYNSAGNPVFGGMHYIYVFGRNFPDGRGVPLYDGCKYIHDTLLTAASIGNANMRKALWKEGMWVSIPILEKGKTLNQTDITVKLRVSKTYRWYNPDANAGVYVGKGETLAIGEEYYVVSGNAIYNGDTIYADDKFTTVSGLTTFASTANVNGFVTIANRNGYPVYNFNTYDLAPILGNMDAAKDALKLVNIVPNPYYAYSAYEGTTGVAGQLDNRIKIVNLPPKCTISIFTLNGVLVKRFIREVAADNSLGSDLGTINTETSVDWDLKNTQGITVASGIYLVHVDAGELGKRTLKWFGVLRPIDVGVY
ncbi:MAG TPA: hypothetical protein VJY62_17225 [Bacteroidia bacterium]|nr:hypothetical protein [Bacteroidia bacterium]